jgi:hypothetical protein
MKKLLILVLLVISVSTGYAQKQFRVIYNEVVVTNKDNKVTRKAVENIIFYNYGNEPIVKMYFNDGSVKMFNQITETAYDKTDDGVAFSYAQYEEQSTNFTMLLQLFYETKYGARLVFKDGQTIQFIP